MANTALLQAVAQMLMQGRPPSPVPAGPMTPPGGFMPLPMGPPPAPAPVAPLPARNESLIEQLTGPRPVAPVAQPDSRLQTIARALLAFSAGVQGQGPQFLANLQEQRERPQREFHAQTEQFEDRRRRAIAFDEGRREREQANIQRQADIQSGREFQMFEMEQRDRMQEARDLRLQAAALEREEVKAKAERIETDRKERIAKEKQRSDIEADLIKSPNFAPAKVAKEIAAAIVDGKPMSAATEKWRSVQAQKAEAQLAKLNAAGTGRGTGAGDAVSLERQFNALKARFLSAEKPTSSQPRGDRALMDRIAAQFPAIMDKLAKLGWEVGYSGIYPYIKPPQGRQQPAAQPTAQAAAPQNTDPLGVR